MTRTESKLLTLLTWLSEETQMEALNNIETGEQIVFQEEIDFLKYKDDIEAHLEAACLHMGQLTGTNYSYKEVEGVYVFGSEARLLDLELQKPLTWTSV